MTYEYQLERERIDRDLPPKPGHRRFRMWVENGCGDRAGPLVYVREDRTPRQYAATAISKAKVVIPNEGPWRLREIEEVGAGVGG